MIKNNNTSFTSCLIVDTISFHRLFLCKLIKNKKHKIDPCSTLKKTEKIKFEDVYLISFFG